MNQFNTGLELLEKKGVSDTISVPASTTNPQGFVKLVDVMPNVMSSELGCDAAIVQAARVSYGDGTKKTSTDVGLVRYLLRNQHTSPFEMVEFKFHIKCPIFVARQWLRHRTASVNEISARYSVMKDEFYNVEPGEVRKQSASNKQCSDPVSRADEETNQIYSQYMEKPNESYELYSQLIDRGVAREVARIHLPVSLMTEFYWKIDLHNLYRFLSLRMDDHAQQEIRDYANAIFDMVKVLCPVSSDAFQDYQLNKITLTGKEVDAIRNHSNSLTLKNESKREQDEYKNKLERLGITFS